jgi:hypothetical protein
MRIERASGRRAEKQRWQRMGRRLAVTRRERRTSSIRARREERTDERRGVEQYGTG